MHSLFDLGCLTCGNFNFLVKKYGDKHICLDCRKNLMSYNNDKVIIF